MEADVIIAKQYVSLQASIWQKLTRRNVYPGHRRFKGYFRPSMLYSKAGHVRVRRLEQLYGIYDIGM